MVKIIGFSKQVDGYQTTAGKMTSALFQNACVKTAEKTQKPFSDLYTKRQATKFFRGMGLVYKTIAN